MSENDKEDPFVAAVIAGNVKEMEQHMKHECEGPLKIAAEHGQTECVRRILERGGKSYSVGKWSEHEFDDDDDDDDDGDDDVSEVVKLANTFVSDSYFDAVLVASIKGHVETLLTLLEFRLFEVTNIQEKYRDYVNAAKERGFQRIEALLESVEDKDVYLKGWKGHNIMNLCLFLGCPSSCLQTMVDHGIGVNGWDYNGYTPIMAAILGRNVECVEFLLSHGADPYDIHIMQRGSFHANGEIRFYSGKGEELELNDPEDKWTDFYQIHVGPTALMYAAAMGNIPILKMMLKAAPKDNIGCPTRFEDFESKRPLHFAADYATTEAVALIMEYEGPEEELDEEPLCNAISSRNTEFFKFYLKKMADRKCLNFKWTLQRCVNTKNSECLKLLLDVLGKDAFEVDDGRGYFEAIESNDPNCLSLFMKQPGFSVDRRCNNHFIYSADGLTGFMFSCRKDLMDVAKQFLDLGANLKAVDAKGRTAAMFAAREDMLKSLEFLFDHQADFDAVDNSGGTVFSAALMGNGNALEFLLKKGAVLNGNELKSVHRDSLKFFSLRREMDGYGEYRSSIPIDKFSKLIQFKTFHWDWCTMVDRRSMHNLLFAAVTSGISPGKFTFKKEDVSPIVFTALVNDANAFRYLVANNYFLPEDYTFFSTDESLKSLTIVDDCPEMTFLVEQFTLKPLSLQTWNMMTISKSMSSSDSNAVPDERNDQVDALPLPHVLKNMLKSKNKLSKLCPRHWKRLGPQKIDNSEAKFDDIVVNGKIVKHPAFEKCTQENCHCGGLAHTLKDISEEDKVEPVFDSYDDEENDADENEWEMNNENEDDDENEDDQDVEDEDDDENEDDEDVEDEDDDENEDDEDVEDEDDDE